jgi:hypothetical protein
MDSWRVRMAFFGPIGGILGFLAGAAFEVWMAGNRNL